MRIGVDVDNVLRDFAGSVLSAFKAHLPRVVLGEYSLDYISFDNINLPMKEKRRLIFGEWVDEIYMGASPVLGAVQSFLAMKVWAKSNGHLIECVTANGGFLSDYAAAWLAAYGFEFDDYHFTGKKNDVGVDWLIDDAPKNWEQWKTTNDESRFILIDHPYNQDLMATHRVMCLSGALDILKFRIPSQI